MRAPGEILLIACYELGHQPLAVAWPAAYLERLGYRPATMDVSVEPFDPERVKRAKLVAISVPMHTALRVGATVAEHVRAINPTCHVSFYGLYASLNAPYLLAEGADSVIGGEVEPPIGELASALESGDLARAPTVFVEGQPAGPHLRRPDLPVPARAQLPALRNYVQLERSGCREPAGYVESSRGCLHRCLHCPIPPVYGGRFFAVPREVVLADIRQQVAAGVTHVTFGDPDFLNGPTHALRVARALHEEFPALTFDFTAKVEHLLRDRAHLAEFAELGCIFIVSAAESLSDEVLANLAKGHTRADIHAALRETRRAGIALRPTWVAFTPWTTLHDYRDILEFIETEGLIDQVDPVQYGLRLLVPPGSLLLDSPAMRPYLGALEPAMFAYRWTHPDPRMDELQTAVSAAVMSGAERGEDVVITYERARTLADDCTGAPQRRVDMARLDPQRARP